MTDNSVFPWLRVFLDIEIAKDRWNDESAEHVVNSMGY
jgi:hypothetical protein